MICKKCERAVDDIAETDDGELCFECKYVKSEKF